MMNDAEITSPPIGSLARAAGGHKDSAGPDDVPVTVAELRDADNGEIWRVTNAAGTVLYAWVDARGWECAGWALGSFLDDVEPVPGREDVPRGQWPVGLATLVAKALADIESEPDTWGEP